MNRGRACATWSMDVNERDPQQTHSHEPGFEWVEGRRHMLDVPYMLPKDLQEISRLDFQHYIYRSVLKGNYLAPITQPTRMLDIGCGTGRWMLEMATEFPNAWIVGLDLVIPTPQETNSIFPPTCTFQQCNVLNGLPLPNKSFDYVHQRLMAVALPALNWPAILNDMVRVTHPNGWIELTETDIITHNRGPKTTQLLTWVAEICRMRGIDVLLPQKIGQLLQAARVHNVITRTYAIPIGRWGGRIGMMARTNLHAIAQAMRAPIMAATTLTLQEYDQLIEETLNECEQYRTFGNLYVAYGQPAES